MKIASDSQMPQRTTLLTSVFSPRFFLASVLLTSMLCLGCGSGALPFELVPVKGTVSYKGKPLVKGLVRFIPDTQSADGQVAGKMAFANIKDGSYSIPADRGATVGKNRIEILSYRATGKTTQVENSTIEVEVQFIPEKYNTNSTLSEMVKRGENVIDFKLE